MNKKTAVGAGLAAASAAAAGYYFYASKSAKKHRKIVAKWAGDMKRDIVKEAKLLETRSPKAVNAIVDRVAKTYEVARSIDTEQIRRAARELKENWDKLQTTSKPKARKRAPKRAAKAAAAR
jgi:hypothetical protein